MTPIEVLKMLKSKIDTARLDKCNYAIETSDIEAINEALLLGAVVWHSEQLEPYEPDNFPKCGLCKSIHDPEICCQD